MRFFKSKLFRSIIVLILILALRNIDCRLNSFFTPKYPTVDISHIISSPKPSSDELMTLFMQTGVSPLAASELIKTGRSSLLIQLNTMFFTKPDIDKNYIFFPFTVEERNSSQVTPLVPLKDGDILVTFNTHTCDWRHGHTAIVTDAARGEILEHKSIGNVSCMGKASVWGAYPAFAVLRYADESVASSAAQYAKEELEGIDYSIFAGIISKDKTGSDSPFSSHCSHIVWQAFMAAGADIDSDGGSFVTPHDIAASDKLGVVQIYGLDAEKYASGVLK